MREPPLCANAVYLAILFFLLPVGCTRAPNTDISKPLPIVLDDSWNVDYAKNSCEENPCINVPKETVLEFENELEVAFTSESACHGLVLTHIFPQAESLLLMLDLDGHRHEHVGEGWGIVNLSKHINLRGSITTPEQLMQQVCKIAKGVGGENRQ
jgi:hypothetical protein